MNFLELVNNICSRTNEVQLTSSTFSTTAGNQGFYSDAKDAVNAAIRQINRDQYNWPFNHVSVALELSAGQARYAYPSDAKKVDFDTFRIRRDTSLNTATRTLKEADYKDYIQSSALDDEYKTGSALEAVSSVPQWIIRAQDQGFILYPIPAKAYTLDYEYYSVPTDLVNYDDEPSIPEQFKYVINEGAMYFAESFRNNPEKAQLYQQRFSEAIDQMRSIYTNHNIYVRSTQIIKGKHTGGFAAVSSSGIGSSETVLTADTDLLTADNTFITADALYY